MPRLTELLKNDLDAAMQEYTEGRANVGTELVKYTETRALISILEALQNIDKSLATIAGFKEAESPFKLEGSAPARKKKE